jgi:hypothetical protein
MIQDIFYLVLQVFCGRLESGKSEILGFRSKKKRI